MKLGEIINEIQQADFLDMDRWEDGIKSHPVTDYDKDQPDLFFKGAKFEEVASFNGFDVYELGVRFSAHGEEIHEYVFKKNGHLAGYISLSPYDEDRYSRWLERFDYPYHVIAIYVDPDFRGQNLAPMFYNWYVNYTGHTIISGYAQTEEGKRLWKKLFSNASLKRYFISKYDDRVTKASNKTALQYFDKAYESSSYLLAIG